MREGSIKIQTNKELGSLKDNLSQSEAKKMNCINPDQLYQEGKDWLTELDLWICELNFLNILLSNKFTDFINVHHVIHDTNLYNRLNILSADITRTQKRILLHVKRQIRLYKFHENIKEIVVLREQKAIADAMKVIECSFWILKKEIFTEVERILKEGNIG